MNKKKLNIEDIMDGIDAGKHKEPNEMFEWRCKEIRNRKTIM